MIKKFTVIGMTAHAGTGSHVHPALLSIPQVEGSQESSEREPDTGNSQLQGAGESVSYCSRTFSHEP